MSYLLLGFLVGFPLFVFLLGIRIVRPTELAVKETLGRYSGFGMQGFNWIVPIFQRMIQVNITEQMTDIEPQEIITEDNLNARVDLVVYFQVKPDEESIKKSLYSVNHVRSQIEMLARTTARNVIGGMAFRDVNSKRKELNDKIGEVLRLQTDQWGVNVVRVELKEIIPPKDVQEAMNKVIMAENDKRAAVDFATAKETEADGARRATIKKAEGDREAAVLRAKGEAEAFDLINKSFTGNAQVLEQIRMTESALKNGSKIILTEKGISPQLLIGAMPVVDSDRVAK